MLSPVLTTRSGSRSASAATHAALRRWPGMRCRSLRWTTRNGRWPTGSTGTANRRTTKALRSTSDAYPKPTAPAAPASDAVRASGCIPRSSHGAARQPSREGACQTHRMSSLKDRLRSDLTDAIRSRDQMRAGTLRMVLTSVSTEEVAGTQARELSDDDILRVVAKEAKKRREAPTAYTGAGRPELAAREDAELAVIETYLPAQLTDDEIEALVTEAVEETGATGMPQ